MLDINKLTIGEVKELQNLLGGVLDNKTRLMIKG